MTTSDKTFDLIEQLRRQGKSFCIATVLRTSGSTATIPGAKAVITADGEIHGFIGGGCVTGAVRRGALECLKEYEPKVIRVGPKDENASSVDIEGIQLHNSNCPSGGTTEFFLEPMRAVRTLLICGASPTAQAILMFAKKLSYRVVVAVALEDQPKMSGASLYLDDFIFDSLNLSDVDAAIIATQGVRDKDALRAVLNLGVGYKGMVCSRRKLKALTAHLVTEAKEIRPLFDALHAPAGIQIGAIEPEEIALSVMSEIIAHQRTNIQQVNEEIIEFAGGAGLK